MAVLARDDPSPYSPSLRLGLSTPQSCPSHRDGTTSSSPCWAPHFVTQQRIMFSNPAPSKPRLSPAATMSDDTLLPLIPSSHCVSILEPATPPQVVVLKSWTISAPICLNCFTFAELWKSDLNDSTITFTLV